MDDAAFVRRRKPERKLDRIAEPRFQRERMLGEPVAERRALE